MAENENDENTQDADQVGKKKSKLKLILIIVGVLILAIGGGVAAMMTTSSENDGTSQAAPSNPDNQQTEPGTEDSATNDPAQPKENNDAEGAGKEQSDSAANGDSSETQKNAATTSQQDQGPNFGRTYTFKPFHLNLGNPLENRYIRLEVAIEYLGGEAQQKEIEARTPQLRDAVISVTTKKTREFLLSPDGKDQLRLEILNQINQYMDKKIERVFITEILIE